MTKLNNPLHSFSASGSLGKALSFVKRLGQPIVEHKPEIPDAKSLAQLSWRHMYLKAVALWHALSAAEKQEWESLARRRHMTGYAWFMSQCLKPNPGIYLPLQGGTMQGDIDMDSHSILNLPAPSANQEAATKKYVDDAEARATYTEGCFAFRASSMSVPHNTDTWLSWLSEEYDTDNIHDNVIAPERLTCKTAGKYIVSLHISWAANATGLRLINLYKYPAAISIITNTDWGVAITETFMTITRLVDLSVNDYLQALVKQTSGGALIIYGGARFNGFSMQRVG